MFDDLIHTIQEEATRLIYHVNVERVPERRQMAQPKIADTAENVRRPAKSDSGKSGRNDPCPCGSGKKFKNCCGK